MSSTATGSLSHSDILLDILEGINSGKLTTYATLKEAVRGIPVGPDKVQMLTRAFNFQRQLYWGFFRDLKADTFPRVWKQLVVEDKSYPQFGELKRFAAIPNTFMALIDIHGYTRFCRESRNNASMIDLLDRMIQEDVTRLCTKSGVLNRRVRGDEILLLGASAFDILDALHNITQYFSRRRRIQDPAADKKDSTRDMELPEFCISAGIAGGQKYASLVITREGDLSGDIVNTAARLQARANKISPDRNRILTTNQVAMALTSPQSAQEKELMAQYGLFSVGNVEFKGLSIGVYDLVGLKEESWRMGYKPVMESLLEALGKGLWRREVLDTSLQLASRLSVACPAFNIETAKRAQITALTRQVLSFWTTGMYEAAIDGFETMVEIINSVGRSDDVVLEYLNMVRGHYRQLKSSFVLALDELIEQKPPLSPDGDDRKAFMTLQKHSQMYRNTKETLRLKHLARGEHWLKTCDELGESFNTSLLSPKT